MKTDEVIEDTVAEPVIDTAASEQAKHDAEMAERSAQSAAEHESVMAELNARRVEEAAIAAVQDAALQAVRDQCDAFRAGLATKG